MSKTRQFPHLNISYYFFFSETRFIELSSPSLCVRVTILSLSSAVSEQDVTFRQGPATQRDYLLLFILSGCALFFSQLSPFNIFTPSCIKSTIKIVVVVFVALNQLTFIQFLRGLK